MTNGQNMHTLPGPSPFPTTRWTWCSLPPIPNGRMLAPLWFPFARATGIRYTRMFAGAGRRKGQGLRQPSRERYSLLSVAAVCRVGTVECSRSVRVARFPIEAGGTLANRRGVETSTFTFRVADGRELCSGQYKAAEYLIS